MKNNILDDLLEVVINVMDDEQYNFWLNYLKYIELGEKYEN